MSRDGGLLSRLRALFSTGEERDTYGVDRASDEEEQDDPALRQSPTWGADAAGSSGDKARPSRPSAPPRDAAAERGTGRSSERPADRSGEADARSGLGRSSQPPRPVRAGEPLRSSASLSGSGPRSASATSFDARLHPSQASRAPGSQRSGPRMSQSGVSYQGSRPPRPAPSGASFSGPHGSQPPQPSRGSLPHDSGPRGAGSRPPRPGGAPPPRGTTYNKRIREHDARVAREEARRRRVALLFAMLETPVGADAATLRQNYRRLLLMHHPDRHADDPARQRAATEYTSRLNRAYDELSRLLAAIESAKQGAPSGGGSDKAPGADSRASTRTRDAAGAQGQGASAKSAGAAPRAAPRSTTTAPDGRPPPVSSFKSSAPSAASEPASPLSSATTARMNDNPATGEPLTDDDGD